jgi:hypothetical protein
MICFHDKINVHLGKPTFSNCGQCTNTIMGMQCDPGLMPANAMGGQQAMITNGAAPWQYGNQTGYATGYQQGYSPMVQPMDQSGMGYRTSSPQAIASTFSQPQGIGGTHAVPVGSWW